MKMVTTFPALVTESLFREKVTSGLAGFLVPEMNNHIDTPKRNYELNTNRNYFFNFLVFVTKI
jgi:hypothetical protein